ncbi:hypothetical protein HWV62_44951 [Athelia sp. TMB]|nr:hypothetical protein HWV62_44951 [Athelia sp. TMB]
MAAADADRTPLVGRISPYPGRKGASSPPLPPTSLSPAHISEALSQSPDNGGTLDLTHKNLTDVGESGAQELATIGREDIVEDESSVLRIQSTCVTPNGVRAPLASQISEPEEQQLLVMPSLEILDMSRNKIKRLPSQPGSLAGLRVFCISKNKLTRLPAYMSEFVNLNILKTDHNPIEWPPQSVMEPAENLEDGQAMRVWIRSVQTWMSDNSEKAGGRKASDESLLSEPIDLGSAADDSVSSQWSRLPMLETEFEAGVTPHARSFSMDSDFSAYSIPEAPEPSSIDSPNRPPPLHLGTLPTYANSLSPRSPDSYLPTPEASVSSTDDDATAVVGSLSQQQQHARNASYAAVGSHGAGGSGLSGKKSLPDLRTAKFNFGGAKKAPNVPTRGATLGPELPSYRLDEGFSTPSPSSHREDSGSSDGRPIPRPRKMTQERSPRSPPPTENPAPAMDVERNSYFRRLSTLPFSTISAVTPPALLSLIDAARSILFAVCQVYQTLQHYTVYAIDERLSSVLRKVLDPASQYMMQLINALDRFDSMSRKTLPSPAVCRSVIECCKDTVAVFGKAVSVLALQLKVLATHDDVRYLRQMLLVLYGATAEISHAWHAMAPHIDAVKPLLREHRKPHKTQASPVQRSPGNSESLPSSSISAPPILNGFGPSNRSSPHISGTPGAGRTRTARARRHAGSFSSKDVEIGKKLPSYDIPQTPTLRSGLRNAPLGTSPLPSYMQAGPLSGRSFDHGDHSRQGSQTSLQPLSSGQSSPSIVTKVPVLEIQPNSKTLVDKETLDAMRGAVEAAPVVWEMMDSILSESRDTGSDVGETLTKAKVITYRLRENINAMQMALPTADKKALKEDAHVFVKTVVQLSNVIKSYGATHAVPSDLRSRMVKLTNSTQEFVILLHVSSFSISSTPLPYSPMIVSATPTGLLAMPEDSRLGASLSRSRSAQATVSSKLALSTRDGPKSALPSQGFNVPWSSRARVPEWDTGIIVPDSLG